MKTCIPHSLPIKNLKWEKLVSVIGEARESLGRFDEKLKNTPSNQIKKLQKQECKSSLKGQNDQKIAFVEEGLQFAIGWAEKKPLNLKLLCRIHAIVKQDALDPKEIGRLRQKQNWIGPHERPMEEGYFYPPKPEIILKSMQNLFQYLRKKEKDPLVQLAIFFAQLLIIHPFMDGNGRAARIFIPVWLWKKGLISKPALFLSAYFEKDRVQYFRKLFYISENEAWEDWIEYFLKGVAAQCNHSLTN